MAALIGILAGLVGIATACIGLWRYFRSRRPKVSARVLHLGELIEHTYTHVLFARFDAAGPAGLAAELIDSTAATKEIWEVARDVTTLSDREVEDLRALCGISAEQPLDYAVFVAAAPLYSIWSKIGLLERKLDLTPSFTNETGALRELSFKALASDVRGIASRAIGERSQSAEPKLVYRVDRSFHQLAVSIGYARSQADASAFLVGAALARIEGAGTIARELSSLGEKSETGMTRAIANVLESIEGAAETIRDHGSTLGLANRRLTDLPPRGMETTLYLKRLQEAHGEWRELVFHARGLEDA